MSSLEAHYRRLLAWFPHDHRRRHEDEMLGVLMAAASPEQRRPGARDTLDLAVSAVRLHARRAFGRGSGPLWRDAVAVAGLIAMLAVVAGQAMSGIWNTGPIVVIDYLAAAAGLAGVLLRRRTLAAAGAWTAVLLSAKFLVLVDGQALSGGLSDSVAYVSLIGPVFAAAVMTVVGPRRGIECLGARRALVWALAGTAIYVLWGLSAFVHVETYELPLLLLMTFLAVAAGIAVRSPTGRRALLLLAVPLMTDVLMISWFWLWLGRGWLLTLVNTLVPLAAFVAFARRGRRGEHPEPAGVRTG